MAGNEISFDWEQAQRELLTEAGIDMEKEMEKQLLCFAEEVQKLFIKKLLLYKEKYKKFSTVKFKKLEIKTFSTRA